MFEFSSPARSLLRKLELPIAPRRLHGALLYLLRQMRCGGGFVVLPMVSPNVERGHTPAICHFRLCLMSNSALSYVQHGRSLVDAVGGIDSLTLESRSLSDCYTSVPS